MTTWIIRLGAATTNAADGFRRQTLWNGRLGDATREACALYEAEGGPVYVVDPARGDGEWSACIGRWARP